MGNRRKSGGESGFEKIKRIGTNQMSVIVSESKRSNNKPKLGPRSIFLDKYKVTKNKEEAKEELPKNGYSLELYNDKIIDTWIEEVKEEELEI